MRSFLCNVGLTAARSPGAVMSVALASLAMLAPLWVARAQKLSVDSPGALYLVPVTYAAGPATAMEPPVQGTIQGTVRDATEVRIAGAVVTLSTGDSNELITAQSDQDGHFTFAGVVAGPYRLNVQMAGFRPWTSSGFLEAGQALNVDGIALDVLGENASVEVVASSREVAEAQVGLEEKQRVLGVFPNFYASYIWNADPLSPRQKFALALRFSADPVFFGTTALIAGAEQWQHDFKGYGQGVQGYGKRFGATYADGFGSTLVGQAILPVVFHQDPRYFVKGTGSVPSRAMYAIATSTVICRGDNGRWQLNYSNILGNIGSAALANLYYPASSRQSTGLTVETSLVSTALGAIGGIFQEFVLHRMTPNVPDYGAVAAGQ